MAVTMALLALAAVHVPLRTVPCVARAAPAVRLARAPPLVMQSVDEPAAPLSVLTWFPVWLALGTSGAVLAAVPRSTMPRLLLLHLCGVAPLLPLGAAARVAVRRRSLKLPPTDGPPPTPSMRKARATWMVKLHAIASAGGLYSAVIGVVAIYANKAAAGKPHLASLHSRVGASAMALWLASYLVAQPHIWRDVWRVLRKEGRLTFRPRYLWADALHRRLGNAAIAVSLAAAASGISGPWGRRVLAPPFVATACGAVLVIGVLQYLAPNPAPSRRRGRGGT